jgi:hypothetical protein
VVARSQVRGFLDAVYEDPALKNRLVLWTFVALVLPTAALVALGLPEKLAYATMAALIFPLQFVVYLMGRPSIRAGVVTASYTTYALSGSAGNVVEVGRVAIRKHPDELVYPLRRDEFDVLLEVEALAEEKRWRDVALGSGVASLVGLLGILAAVDWSQISLAREWVPVLFVALLGMATVGSVILFIVEEARVRRVQGSGFSNVSARIKNFLEEHSQKES